MSKFEIIIFDIDGTLTESKQELDPDMAELICELLSKYKVAIISGASMEQFNWQILSQLKCSEEKFNNLYLLPTDGTVMCDYQEGKLCRYDDELPQEEKDHIKALFSNIFEQVGLETPEKFYGDMVEDRGAQMNFSALGQDAPLELKEAWDPDNSKRRKIVEALKEVLPGYALHIGGTTSIEITKAGVDKAYGIKKLIGHTGITKEKMLYVGDKLFKGGNDEPALSLGLATRAVHSPKDTKALILELLSQKR